MIRIIFVDDVPDLLEIGKQFLEMNSDFIVDTTTSGKKALQLIQNNTYDVIISDYSMPEMNGLEFLIQVRSINTFIPFIFLTSQDEERLILELLNNGADYFMQKEHGIKLLFHNLSQIIRLFCT